jgi:hypothetical protein
MTSSVLITLNNGVLLRNIHLKKIVNAALTGRVHLDSTPSVNASAVLMTMPSCIINP